MAELLIFDTTLCRICHILLLRIKLIIGSKIEVVTFFVSGTRIISKSILIGNEEGSHQYISRITTTELSIVSVHIRISRIGLILVRILEHEKTLFEGFCTNLACCSSSRSCRHLCGHTRVMIECMSLKVTIIVACFPGGSPNIFSLSGHIVKCRRYNLTISDLLTNKELFLALSTGVGNLLDGTHFGYAIAVHYLIGFFFSSNEYASYDTLHLDLCSVFRRCRSKSFSRSYTISDSESALLCIRCHNSILSSIIGCYASNSKLLSRFVISFFKLSCIGIGKHSGYICRSIDKCIHLFLPRSGTDGSFGNNRDRGSSVRLGDCKIVLVVEPCRNDAGSNVYNVHIDRFDLILSVPSALFTVIVVFVGTEVISTHAKGNTYIGRSFLIGILSIFPRL